MTHPKKEADTFRVGYHFGMIILFLIGLFASTAHAYIDYAPNANLIEEVNSHPFRLFPKSDHYAFAVDADFFKPVFIGDLQSNYYRYDAYHGNGYWLTLRGEYKPVQQVTLDLKTIVTHGTSSNGPTYNAIIVPMVGITYQEDLLGFNVKFRLSDIGRQTVGTGLFIEEKETDGGYAEIKKDDFAFKMMVDGTGSYRLDGGVVAFDSNLWNGVLGVTAMFNESDPVMQAPNFVGTVYSKKTWSNGLGYGVEVGGDHFSWAGITYVQYQGEWDRFHFWVKPQVRHYGSEIMGQLPGRVNQNFVAYDQNDKPYTSFMDIMAYGDNVTTYSTQLNAEYVFNTFYRAFGETEALLYHFVSRPDVREFFFRAGFKLFPFKNRNETMGLLVGNKYLNASTGGAERTYSLPNITDLENKPLFLRQLYYMLNFSTQF